MVRKARSKSKRRADEEKENIRTSSISPLRSGAATTGAILSPNRSNSEKKRNKSKRQ